MHSVAYNYLTLAVRSSLKATGWKRLSIMELVRFISYLMATGEKVVQHGIRTIY